MKCLVTGATGFVGSWLTRALLDAGHEVHILRRKNSDLENLIGLDLHHHIGDITQIDSLIEASKGADVVFHLAGLVGYNKSMRQAMVMVNVVGTANVIEACSKNKVPRLVYMSSVVAVGASFDGKNPLNEASDYNVKHLDLGYFETKHAAEKLVLEAVEKKIIDAVILNPSTIYGPGDSKKGSRGVQLKVAKGSFPFYTSGGVNVVAVEDVVQAVLSAWKKGQSGERYILAGENILIKDLFRMIAAESGVSAPKILLPNWIVKAIGKWGDSQIARGKKAPLNSENAWTSILFHWFDSQKAQEHLDFKPRPAIVAVRSSIRWSQENNIL